jgi:hypothetical protein
MLPNGFALEKSEILWTSKVTWERADGMTLYFKDASSAA